MIVSCWSYLGWILLNSEDTINSGLFISVGSMFDDKEEELYKMHCRGLYPTLSLKFQSGSGKANKFSLYGKAKSHIYLFFPNRLHALKHQWGIMVGGFVQIKDDLLF